jgi:hypothetical protein
VEYCDTPETERREQTGNTKHTYTLEASSLLDREPLIERTSSSKPLSFRLTSFIIGDAGLLNTRIWRHGSKKDVQSDENFVLSLDADYRNFE